MAQAGRPIIAPGVTGEDPHASCKNRRLVNPLTLYGLLKVAVMVMPQGPFRLGFSNGLMSEAMLLWFGATLLWHRRRGASSARLG